MELSREVHGGVDKAGIPRVIAFVPVTNTRELDPQDPVHGGLRI
jgi:hypothetical protein